MAESIVQSAKSRAESHGHYTKQSVISFWALYKIAVKIHIFITESFGHYTKYHISTFSSGLAQDYVRLWTGPRLRPALDWPKTTSGSGLARDYIRLWTGPRLRPALDWPKTTSGSGLARYYYTTPGSKLAVTI